MKKTTLERFQRLRTRRRRCPTVEPSMGQGVSPLGFAQIINSLANNNIHGTVIRRLRRDKPKHN